MSPKSFTISAEYNSLIDALRDESSDLLVLMSEMKGFNPSVLSPKEVESTRKEKARLKELNPHMTEEELINSSKVDNNHRFFVRFNRRLTNASTKIILLSSSVIEAVINVYLAMRVNDIGDYELFDDIEKMDLIKKWTLLPKLFDKSYTFDKSGKLYQQLRMLKRSRDSFSHYKVTLEVNGKKVLKGSVHPHPGKTMFEQATILMEYASLSGRLIKHLMKFDQNNMPSVMYMLDHSLNEERFKFK